MPGEPSSPATQSRVMVIVTYRGIATQTDTVNSISQKKGIKLTQIRNKLTFIRQHRDL